MGVDHLFAYGSLMSGLEFHSYIVDVGGVFVGKARARGRLYVCEYPAFIAGDEGEVAGELFSFPDIGAALPVLDDVELEGTMYHRIVVRPALADGRTIAAYVYQYAVSVRSCAHVASGDYRQFLAARG